MKRVMWLALFLMSSLLNAEDNEVRNLKKPAVESTQHFDVNRITSTIHNNGTFARNPITGNANFFYDQYEIIYVSGLWFGAKVNGEIRASASDYNTDFTGGAIDETGVPFGKNDPAFRVYKISKNDNANNNIDYAEWPIQYGAPAENFGNPLLLGDQTLWCSFVDNYIENREYNICQSLGAEVHQTVWGWKDVDNEMFVRWEFINKSEAVWENFYVGIFSDPDITNPNNDLVGSDSTLNLMYCYDYTEQQYMLPFLGVGYVLLESPATYSPGDTAMTFWGQKPNFKNVQVYSPKMTKSTADGFQDPPYRTERTAEILYNRFMCLSRDGEPVIDPETGLPSKWVYSGDPVTGSGWIERLIHFADRRMMLSTGPVDVAPGDTTAVMFAIVPVRRFKNTTCVFDIKQQARATHSMFRYGTGIFTNQIVGEQGEQNVNFPIYLLSESNIQRIEFTVSLPENLLEFIDVVTTERAENAGMTIQTLQQGNKIQIFLEAHDRYLSVGNGAIAELHLNISQSVDSSFIDFDLENIRCADSDNDIQTLIPASGTIKIVAFPESPRLVMPQQDQYFNKMKIDFSWTEDERFESAKYRLNIFSDGFNLNREIDSSGISIPIRQFISNTKYEPVKNWTVRIDNFDFPVFSPDTFSFRIPNYQELDFAKNPVEFFLPSSDSNRITMDYYYVFEPYIYYFYRTYNPTTEVSQKKLLVLEMERSALIEKNRQDINYLNTCFLTVENEAYSSLYDTLRILSIDSDKHLKIEKTLILNKTVCGMSANENYLVVLENNDDTYFLVVYQRLSGFDLNKIAEINLSTWWFGSGYLVFKKAMVLENNLLYLALGKWGVIDLTQPESPQVKFAMDVPGKAMTLAVENGKVYIGNSDNWIGVYDISELQNPQMIYGEKMGEYSYSKRIDKIFAFENRIYFETNDSNYPGLQACHYETGTGFVLDGLFEAANLYFSEDRLFAADYQGRFRMFENSLATSVESSDIIVRSFRLYQNYPNPFNTNTKIKFSLEKDAVVSLKIFNLLGQLIFELDNQKFDAGVHTLDWGTKTIRGIQVTSGIYFYQLIAGEEKETKKMVLLF